LRPARGAAALLVLVLLLSVAAKGSFADDKNCPMSGAEYVPQHQAIADGYDRDKNLINKTLFFVLRIERVNRRVSSRGVFLNFDAYDKSGKRLSTMRFGDTWSNGLSRQSFSTYWGQYHEYKDAGWKELKSAAAFYPIGVNKGYSQSTIEDAPYLLIFPGTLQELTYLSFNRPQNWDDYIRFYTKDRVYPDFRGYDFWVRRKCGDNEDKR
jgi:hypothetical protein